MNEKIVSVIPLVDHLEGTEGHIPDGGVKKTVREVCFLKPLDSNGRLLIKLLGDAAGDTVQLHAVEFGVCQGLRAHTDKVADAAGRLQQVSGLEAHACERLIDGSDDHGRGVKGRQGGLPGCGVLVLGQQGFQLGILAVALVKAVGQTAPAHIPRQHLLLLRGGKPVLSLQPFQQADGPDIVVEPLSRRSRADGVIGDVVLMPVCIRDFRMEDKGGHLGPALGLGRGQWRLLTTLVVPIH